MIEFALLFGLGFLSAALAVMLIAPAVHRRVVRYTENRIQATLPISPQEVRAQRDMARAVYAAENARTRQELVGERDKAVALQLKNDTLSDEAKRLHAEGTDLRTHIDTLDTEAAEGRSRLRASESQIQQLKAVIGETEDAAAAKDAEIENLRQRQARLIADSDNLRIDLSTRDTELENVKVRLTALRDERDTLRNDVRAQTNRAKEAEMRFAQEENRLQRLEDKLAREIADRSDRENALERRQQEIDRLREKLKTANAEARGASRALREATAARPAARSVTPKKKITPEDINLRQLPHEPETREIISPASDMTVISPAVSAIAEEAKTRAMALTDRLKESDAADDEAIRLEIAEIAAGMVAMTAAQEGSKSPIHKILSGKSGSDGRKSLAARSKAVLASSRNAAE